MTDIMQPGGGRTSDREATRLGIPGFEVQIPITGGTFYWAPPEGTSMRLLGAELLVVVAVVSGTADPTVKVGNTADDDGLFTAKTIVTTTAADVMYSTWNAGLAKGAFFTNGLEVAGSLVTQAQPLKVTATAGTDGGTAAGVFFLRVFGEWYGDITHQLAAR